MKLTYDSIRKATKGDNQAMDDILRYYDHYIDSLCAYEITDDNNIARIEIDYDIKAKLQLKLIEAVKKWRKFI